MSTETAAFEELGLRPGASDAEIKAAWRKLASRWHPDRNASRAAVEKMQRINQAFELLRGAMQPPAAAAPPTRPPAPAPAPATPQPEASGPEAPRPLNRRIKLTLEEAALGCLRVLRGQVVQACTACEGQGLRFPMGDCAGCEGTGQVRQRAWYGWLASTAPCEDCGGDGRARQRCEPCGGSGKLPPRKYELKVRIPPGVRDGDLLGVPGGRAAGSPPGGVDLQIELQPHALFTLDDDGTVRCDMPVDGFSWLGGRSVEVPTLEGVQPMALRHGERVYRLRGQGFPASRRGERADLVVTVSPVFPQSLSTDQQILLDRLIATTTSAPTGPLVDWQRRLRGAAAGNATPTKPARKRTPRA